MCKGNDYDKDGDLDLFIAGRVIHGIIQNRFQVLFIEMTKNGKIKFTDVTSQLQLSLINIGLVCDAIWTDFDNDGWQDLVLAGEWMPVTFLKNDNGIFKNVTSSGRDQ